MFVLDVPERRASWKEQACRACRAGAQVGRGRTRLGRVANVSVFVRRPHVRCGWHACVEFDGCACEMVGAQVKIAGRLRRVLCAAVSTCALK